MENTEVNKFFDDMAFQIEAAILGSDYMFTDDILKPFSGGRTGELSQLRILRKTLASQPDGHHYALVSDVLGKYLFGSNDIDLLLTHLGLKLPSEWYALWRATVDGEAASREMLHRQRRNISVELGDQADAPRLARLDVARKSASVESVYGSDHVELYHIQIHAFVGEEEAGSDMAALVGSLQAALVRLDPNMNRWDDPDSPEANFGDSELIYKLLHRGNIPLDEDVSVLRPAVFLSQFLLDDSCRKTRIESETVRRALTVFADRAEVGFLLLPPDETGSAASSNKAALRYAQMGFKPLRLGGPCLWLDLDSPEFR